MYECSSQEVLTSVSRSLVKDLYYPLRSLLEVLLNHCSSNRAVFVKVQVGSKMEADEKRGVKTKYQKNEVGKEN